MQKTTAQEKLEYQHRTATGEPGQIKQIVIDVLEKYRGRRVMLLAAVDLEITDTTLYNWCHDLGIDPESYKFQRQPVTKENQEEV